MDLRLLRAILLVTFPGAVMLSVCIGWGFGYLCLVVLSTWYTGMISLQSMISAPSSDSVAEDITTLMICEIVMTSPLFSGMALLPGMKYVSLRSVQLLVVDSDK